MYQCYFFSSNILENIAGNISFRCKHDGNLSSFYYQSFLDLEFTTALLLFPCSKHINKSDFPIFVKMKNQIDGIERDEVDFRQILLRIKRLKN